MEWANVIVWVVLGYALVGVVCGVGFVWRGVARVDHGAKGSPLGFRLMILPGAAALWPWVMVKWAKASVRHAEGPHA